MLRLWFGAHRRDFRVYFRLTGRTPVALFDVAWRATTIPAESADITWVTCSAEKLISSRHHVR